MAGFRVMVDGVFDCTHFGHANSLRQARQFGDTVIAVIHPDSEVLKHKHCRPVFPEHERYALMKAQRYVDATIEDVRYDFDLSDIESMNIDFVAHGDEPVHSGAGVVLYQDIQDAGKYRYFHRTAGTCTTDIIEAILGRRNLGRTHPNCCIPNLPVFVSSFEKLLAANHEICQIHYEDKAIQILKDPFHFPGDEDSVVFIYGNFELFSYGHLKFFHAVNALSPNHETKLVIGIVSDSDINREKGPGRPLVNAIQRAANVLSYKGVLGVVFLPDDHEDHLLPVMEHYGLHKIAVGRSKPIAKCLSAKLDGLEVQVVDSGSNVTTSTIIQRILTRKSEFIKRNYYKTLSQLNN